MKKRLQNQKIKSLGVLLILIVAGHFSFAQTSFTVGGIKYNVTDATNKKVEVVPKSLAYTGDINIPNTVTNGGIDYSVTSIGNNAFFNCSDLTSVSIPNSVTSIRNGAFNKCFGLTSLSIPNSVTSIGNSAFAYCGLTSVTIPNSVTIIEISAFSYCSSLTSVSIPNSLTSIKDWAFGECKRLASVTIPNSVTSIGKSAFRGCSGLTSLSIPNSVTTIESAVFYDCSGLTSVTIPNSVTSIGNSAFRGCSGLTSLTIPNSVTSIGYQAFRYCSGLTSLSIPNSVTNIGNYAFSNCSGLTSVTIPNSNSVTSMSIGDNAFMSCSGLTSVTIGNSVTSIGSDAFSGCSSLKSVTIPTSVTSIGGGAFRECSDLTSVVCEVADLGTLSMGSTVFFNANQLYATLYVPSSALASYRTANQWKDFGKFKEISQSGSSCTDIVNIPDANFKKALLAHGTTITGDGISKIDTDGDGEICKSEAAAYKGVIDVHAKNISSLTGIEGFVNIIKLSCVNNKLTSLDLSKNKFLKVIYCSSNLLTSINISNSTLLTELYCHKNQLTSLDLAKNTSLRIIECYSNSLTSLNVTQNIALTKLVCDDNKLKSIDLSKNKQLSNISCSDNQLTSLEVTNNTTLTTLDCSKNNLTSLNVANGKNARIGYLHADSNPNLTCIQHDAGYKPIAWDANAMAGWKKDATAKWSDNCSGSAPVNYTVSVSETVNGTIKVDKNSAVAGTQITATATPESGYKFVKWTGDVSGTTNPLKFTLNKNTTVGAEFTKIQDTPVNYTVSVSETVNGTVKVDKNSAVAGTQITATATPASGYKFVKWTGDVSGTANPLKFTLNKNTTVGAEFISINVAPILGLDDEAVLAAYPNPMTDVVTIKSDRNESVVFYDVTGRKVLIGTTNTLINVADLEKGIYTVVVNGQSMKLVKR